MYKTENFINPLESDYDPEMYEGIIVPETKDFVLSPLTENSENTIKNIENKVCRHVVNKDDNKPQIDLVNNYRIFQHPNDENSCYMRLDDTLVDGECSTANQRLFRSDFKDVISEIKPENMRDPYVAKTLKYDLCKIGFKTDKPERKIAYASFIDENDPKVAVKQAEMKLNEEYKRKLQNDIHFLVNENQGRDLIIAEQNMTIANMTKQKQNKSEISFDLTEQINHLTEDIRNFNFSSLYNPKNTTGSMSLQTSPDTCVDRETPLLAAGGYKTNFLDRHDIKCNNNEYITNLRFDTYYNPDKAKFKYQCCPINPNMNNIPITKETKTTPWNDPGGFSAIHLDRHDINCGDNGLLHQVKIDTRYNPDQIRYNYTCVYPQFPASAHAKTVCSDLKTQPNKAGKTTNYLDKHSLYCPAGQGLSRYKLTTEKDATKYSYDYRCCSTLFRQNK